MYAVLDTNQASQLAKLSPRPGLVKGITLSELILAEIVLNASAVSVFSVLGHFRLRWGMKIASVLEVVASLSPAEIAAFKPFMPDGTCTLQSVKAAGPTPAQLKEARRIKDRNRAFCDAMFDRAKAFRQRITSKNAQRKFDSIEQAVAELPSFPSMVVDWVSNGARRPLKVADPQGLYPAVIANQHLRRLFYSLLYYILAWSRAWSNQSWNFDPSSKLDDWTDATLPLYAADGDVVLTADKKLRNALKAIEPAGAIQASTVSDLR